MLRRLVLHPWLGVSASIVGCALAALAGYGSGLEGLQAVTRYTGRAGLFWFGLVFAIAPLARIAPGAWTRVAFAARRKLGLAFGLHHLVHLALLLVYLDASGRPLDPSRAAGGALAYVALVAMMATSNDAARNALGARAWSRVHRVCLWYLWIVFMITYVSRLEGKGANVGGSFVAYAFCFAVVLALALLRVSASVFRRRSPLQG